MDDAEASALLSAIYEPNERELQILLQNFQPTEIVKLPEFKARIHSRERNIHCMLDKALLHYTWITSASLLWPDHVLRLRDSAPIGFWLAGDCSLIQRVGVSFVGSRICSTYGEGVARQFAREISSTTMTVVAGGAIGIEQAAHHGGLQSDGKTICVLAGGLTHMYPRENKKLFHLIEDEGLMISEVAPWRRAKPHWFLMRNRIIAALSEALVVIEARKKSGALSSVTHANSIGIDVCVVPGTIYSPFSEGSHALVQDGATLVTSAKDIIKSVLPSIELQRLQAQFACEPSV